MYNIYYHYYLCIYILYVYIYIISGLVTTCKSRKRRLGQEMKSLVCPDANQRGLICPCKILNSSSRIHIDLFNRIHYKVILLTLLFKSLFFITNLNCSYVLLLDIFSVVTQLGFWYFKSAFANRKSSYLVSKCTMYASNLELKH